MLSRSNSNAGDRLRRAKSSSSAYTSSSGHQRSSTSIDPFVIRQHAETAAFEAFHRARQMEEPCGPQAYRPVPPKLQRRRSQATGRTEGSHFEDARLGRRRSTSKKDENRGPKLTRSQHFSSEPPLSEAGDGEVVITRKRSVIPPSSGPRYSLYDPSVVSSSRNERRKSQATYTDGSPAPRNTATSQRGSAADPHTPHSRQPTDEYFSAAQDRQHIVQPPMRETQIDEEIIALAQDHPPHERQSKRLRERKSFLLAPFQKRRAATIAKGSGNSYDTGLPPFNYADDSVPPPPIPPPVYTAPAFTVSHEKKSRTLSDSLKGRFKKVFRKATRVPTVIPAQHVESTHLHYPVTTPLSTPTVQPEQQGDPFTVSTSGNATHITVPDSRVCSNSRQSSGGQSAAKSRVTSWTNSTVAGTWSTRDDVDDHDITDEHGRLKRSGSTSTLRKARSFFGRPVKNKLRRASKLDLQGSEESTGLYSALQERIQPADSASQAAVSETETQGVKLPSALDTLPSRQRAESTVSSSRSGWQLSTIRSVTPDSAAYRLDIPSPVAEVLSPEASRPRSRQEDMHDESTPKSQLHRRPAMKAPTPSKEQIERRMERCKNRWQSPLDALSPSAPRPSKHALDENPYELRSLSRTLHQPMGNDLPHHARIGEQLASGRPDVLSPSVYSRGTDGESPRPDTPAAQGGGLVVTITGREVKSYAISPSKTEQPAERPIHASQEWRRWLSDEMNGWDGSSAPQDFKLPKSILKDTPPTNIDAVVATTPSERRNASESPSLDPPRKQIENKPHRPRPSSRLSSYMNDRYPMIDTGRNSSDQSVGRKSRISSRADSRPGTAESGRKSSAPRERKPSAEGKTLKSALARQRVVTKPKSMAQMASSGIEKPRDEKEEFKANPSVATTSTEFAGHTAGLVPSRPGPTKRPKSAFDLRAKYKNGTHAQSGPLEVRRKANASETPNILEDSTIMHISAGPYAAHDKDCDNKENVHPASEPAGLQQLSSSEWLATGTKKTKQRDVQNLSAVPPAYRDRSGSRYSPSRSGTGTPTAGLQGIAGGGGSPGHRLASSWLEGRRSKESSPAFV